MGTFVESYLTRMRGCAARMGREMATISDRNRAVRLVEADARSVERGFAAGWLAIESVNRVRTLDQRQGTAWLVEGDPAHVRWEYLPHLAAYVELIAAGYPPRAVRFETSDSELRLDLAAVDEDGRVLVLGEARAEPIQLTKLEALVSTFEGDPGWPGRDSTARDALKLAHQLWATRAPYLWLVASGARRAYRVSYERTIKLAAMPCLPDAEELWPSGFDGPTPVVMTHDGEPVAG